MGYGFNNNPTTSYCRRGDLPGSFEECRALEESKRANWTGKIAHNTYLERLGATHYGIRFHRTIVVEFFCDGTTRLDTGGWQTVTTRDRINRCGIRMGQAGGITSISWGGQEWTYLDGMILKADGSVLYPTTVDVPPHPDECRRARRRLLRKRLVYPLENRQSNFLPNGNATWEAELSEPWAPCEPPACLADRPVFNHERMQERGDADRRAPEFAEPLAPLPEWFDKVDQLVAEVVGDSVDPEEDE